MRSAFLIPLAAMLMVASNAQGQTKIWRCGNTYTNDAAEAKAKGCKPMEGGNVTIVEGTRPNGGGTTKVAGSAPASTASQKVDSSEQRARDTEARAILEAELKKAETKHADLLKEWNNGEPEKQGPEHRNHQKYLDRVAELKASISRSENDIAGLKREIARQGGTAPASK